MKLTPPQVPLLIRDARPIGDEALSVDVDQNDVVVTITQFDGLETDFRLRPEEARLLGASLRAASRRVPSQIQEERNPHVHA